MTEPDPLGESEHAEYIPFEEFRNGLPFGRFHVIVNPDLVRPFVTQRVAPPALAIAILGCGLASALAGYVWLGAALVGLGVLLRHTVKTQAAKILLQLSSRNAATYLDATTNGIMEVRRAQ
jgi:hypothetical protein